MAIEDTTYKKQRFDDAVFVASNLEHKRLTTDRELQDIKWIGYRFLTPLAATRLFTKRIVNSGLTTSENTRTGT